MLAPLRATIAARDAALQELQQRYDIRERERGLITQGYEALRAHADKADAALAATAQALDALEAKWRERQRFYQQPDSTSTERSDGSVFEECADDLARLRAAIRPETKKDTE